MLDDVIFLCKFAAAWLLPPGIFLLALLYLVRRLWRAAKRRLAAFASSLALIMYLLSTPLISSLLVKELEGVYPLPDNPAGDVIIMLGEEPSAMCRTLTGWESLPASPPAAC